MYNETMVNEPDPYGVNDALEATLQAEEAARRTFGDDAFDAAMPAEDPQSTISPEQQKIDKYIAQQGGINDYIDFEILITEIAVSGSTVNVPIKSVKATEFLREHTQHLAESLLKFPEARDAKHSWSVTFVCTDGKELTFDCTPIENATDPERSHTEQIISQLYLITLRNSETRSNNSPPTQTTKTREQLRKRLEQ